jgi:pimeloyl-ACP methyl ester carboxylesterase
MTKTHVVALVHGIRTDGRWAEMVKNVLSADGEIVVKPLGYGYFNVFFFLCPLLTRGFPVREIHQKLRTLEKDNRDKELSIIAHSFGTYIVARILSKDRNLDVKRLIFCGSVVKRRFDWTNIKFQIRSQPALNECGSRDVWPVFAHRMTFGFGPTGTYGFRDPIVQDRFHEFAHSDYFDSGFVREYWLPFIKSGEMPQTEWEKTGKARTPMWLEVLARTPLRWIILIAIAWAGYEIWQRLQP